MSASAPTIFPWGVRGMMSPYPTVVMVTMFHQIAAGMFGKSSAAENWSQQSPYALIRVFEFISHVAQEGFGHFWRRG